MSLIKVLSLFIFSLLFTCCKAIEKNKVVIYYSNINSAENLIVNNKLDSAIFYYNKAFRIKEPFSEDLQNALLTSINIKDTSFIQQWVNHFFILKEIDSNYVDNPVVKALKKNQIDLNHCSSSSLRLNDKYKNILDTILLEDQQIRNICIDEYGYKFYQNPQARKKIKVVDSINVEKILSIQNELGYLSEYDLGFEGIKAIYIIGIHATMWKNKDLADALLKDVIKGYYNNSMYARLKDRSIPYNEQGLSSYYGETEGEGYSTGYIIPKFQKFQSDLDLRRDSIYLEKYQVSRMKMGWMYQNKSLGYYFGELQMFGLPAEHLEKKKSSLESNNFQYWLFPRK